MYSSLDAAIQQAISASLACFHTSILQKIITLSTLWLKWHLNSSNFTLIFVSQSLRHFDLGLHPSLFIPLWKSAGLYCNFSACVLRYAWQNPCIQLIASYFCFLRKYSIAIYLPALHSSIIQQHVGLKSNSSFADGFNTNSLALYFQCITSETDEEPPLKMSNKLFIFIGLYFSTISAGKMNLKLYQTLLIKAHSVLFSHNPALLLSNLKPTTLEIFQECLLC